jgi:hypothetical protein
MAGEEIGGLEMRKHELELMLMLVIKSEIRGG